MGFKALSASLFVALLILGTARAAIDISLEGPGNSFSPGAETLDSNLTVGYTEPISKDSWLHLYMDTESIARAAITLDRYIKNESLYEYSNITFRYALTADGEVKWDEYPEQEFWYSVQVSGLCGNESCFIGEPPVDICESCQDACGNSDSYPCHWSSSTGTRYSTIDGNPIETGLKFIYDMGSGGIPEHALIGTVKWDITRIPPTPEEVDLSMRVACGSGEYGGRTVWEDGWVFQTIASPSIPCSDYVSGFDCRVSILPFDDDSMTEGFRRFGGPGLYSLPSGGVFKTKEPVVREYQQRGTDVEWNGTTGEIVLKDYESDATYLAAYLPPNGPLVCAYTSYSVPNSTEWSRSVEQTPASAVYGSPFTESFAVSELGSMSGLQPPECPLPPGQELLCDKSDVSYGAEETSDPEDGIELSSSVSQGRLSVTGEATKRILAQKESFSIDLSAFEISISDMSSDRGKHTLRAVLSEGSEVYREENITIFICDDLDGDGYCQESGDCNDTNPLQNPGREEVCNGLDDDCNGIIDDGIAGMGELVGQPCNSWPGSVCEGTYVCNPNGTEIICKPESGIYPGELPEYCNNMLDDDCDGAIDEDEGFVLDGVPQPPCQEGGALCIEGDTRPCGQCKDGTSICIDGTWGPCSGASEPSQEKCNGKDDDCNGIIDDVYGKTSIEGTRCQCYNGNEPLTERCNNIDDDCDGRVDEGVTGCCNTGRTRNCGIEEGACEFGIQECENGEWGDCRGAVQPKAEVCCNGLDDDCDGETDEGCGPCGSDSDPFFYYMLIGIGAIMLIGVFVFTQVIEKNRLRF